MNVALTNTNGNNPRNIYYRLILLLAIFFAVPLFSKAQQVTFTGKNVTVEAALKAVKKQTGYVTVYSDDLLESTKPVSIQAIKMPLNDFLTALLKDQPIQFSIASKTIILTAKRPPADTQKVGDVDLPKKNSSVRVTVQDGNGNPLQNASIRVKGSNESGQSGPNGLFIINAKPGDILVISYVGYEKQEIEVKGEGVFVPMKRSDSPLDEVQVIAYGTTTKRFNTGNTSTIKKEDIEKQPVMNVLDVLSGLVPGLQITQQNGLPGSNYKVELRGQNSILNSGTPLYIIDGIPYNGSAYNQVGGSAMLALGKLQILGNSSEAGQLGLSPLNSISPADIESIDVLKDADATAIYGSRGANGVILITTKRGKAGTSQVTANVYNGSTFLSKTPKYLSTEQYLAGRRELFRNDGTVPGQTDYDLNGTWDPQRHYDLAKEMVKSTNTSTAYVSISGGNNQTQYLISSNYSIVKPPYDGDFSDKRLSTSFNISNTAFDNKFKISLNGTYSVDNNTLPGMATFANLNLPPTYPAFHNTDGTLNWWGTSAVNPYADLLKNYNAKTKMLDASLSLAYKLLSNLNLNARFGYTNSDFNELRINPITSMNPLVANNVSSALYGQNTNSSWIFEPTIDYKLQTKYGNISALAGATIQENLLDGQTTVGYNYLSDAALSNIAAASQTITANSYTKYRYAAIYGRITYQLDDKYILNFTARRDGSSRFAPDKRIANFGAIGAAWIFSEEGLIKDNLPFISFGKLRGSYGLTGNDGIGDYRYLNTYTINGNKYYGQPSLFPTRLFSTDYSWESNKKLEVGMELGFLKDHILFTVSKFRNRSSNQLTNVTLAPSAGINQVQANLAALVQNAGWEFELKTKNIQKGKFSWETSMNLTKTSNKLLAFPGLAQSSYADTYVVGQPLNLTKIYQSAGVDPLTGLYIFQKADGTLASWGLTQSDRTARVITTPDFYGMITNTVRYDNWSLYFTFRFVKQIGKNALFNNSTGPFSSLLNLPDFYLDLDHWQKPGDISQVQKYSNIGFANTAYQAASNSTIAYSDASFIRLKTVSLSYSLPKSWARDLHVNGVNVYCNAQNLFTLTNYYGFDPETQGGNLPPLRTVVWGVQVTF